MEEKLIEIAKVTFDYDTEKEVKYLNKIVEEEYDVEDETEAFAFSLVDCDLISETDLENGEATFVVSATNYRISNEYGSFEELSNMDAEKLDALLDEHAEEVDTVVMDISVDLGN